MGLFGGSSRSTSNVQNNIDSSTRNFNQAGAGLALVGSNNTITTTDHGVIDLVKDVKTGVFDLAKSVAFNADESSRRAYEFSGKSTDSAYALSRYVVDTNKETISNTMALARGAMSNADQQSIRSYQFAQGVKVQSQFQPDTVKVLAGVGLVFGLAVIYGISKK